MSPAELEALASTIPNSWAMPTVAEVGGVRLGRQRSPSKMTGLHATPYLRAGNIAEDGLDLDDVLEMDFDPQEREVYMLRDGDVVLAEASGSASQVGRPAIWRGEIPLCCFQNTVIRFRPHAVSPEYARAVFKYFAVSGIFGRVARGIGLLHLGANRFSSMPFPLPPAAEQARIVAVLDEKLKELSQARDALSAALVGTRQQDEAIIAAAATGELCPGTRTGRAISSAPDVRARIAIPAEWAWRTIGEVGELTLGKALGAGGRRGARRPYLRVANVLEDHIDLDDLKKMPFTAAEVERYALRAGDVLLNDGQSPELVGRPAIYGGELENLCFQNHLIRFRAGSEVDPRFALLVFRHYLHAGEFRRIARGSTNIANLSRSRLASMPFPLPPLAEQQNLVDEARHRLAASADQREAISTSLEHAVDMVRELLRAAVSGDLVRQDPDDEPAAELLRRLGPQASAKKPAKVRRVSPKPSQPKPSAQAPAPAPAPAPLDLAHVLAPAPLPMTVEELCRASGVDINDVGDIERFYTSLRDELKRSAIRLVESSGEPAVLEVVS